MTPAFWPLRLVPRRSPSFFEGLAVTAVALAAAVGLRLILIGLDKGLGPSVTYFPALIATTILVGARWGWTTLAVAVGLNFAFPSPLTGADSAPLLALFAASSALTVALCQNFRIGLLRLEEAAEAQARAQRTLEATESRFRALADSAPILMWVTRTDGKREFANKTYVDFLDVSYQEAIDFDWRRVLHPEDMARILQEQVAGEASRQLFTLEARYRRHDGEYRWVRSVSQPRWGPDGGFAGFVGVGYDITEPRRADDMLRESEDRFRTLADSAPVMMWISGRGNRREFVNQAYLEFLGVDYETATQGRIFERIHPEDRERIQKESAQQATSDGRITVEARYRRADGEWRWLLSISQPRRGAQGERTGYIGVAYDTTEARRAEEDLKRINDLLAERVEAALAERDEAEAALQRAQKLEAVGQLTGGVAHDFNNLLTVIIGALDLMQRHPKDEARRQRMIEAAQGAARRGERLTQQLLAFSRRQALKPEPVQVDALLKDTEPLLRRAVGEAVTLVTALGGRDCVVSLDPSQFEAALMNLVVNARDATPSGGMIRIETLPVTLSTRQVEALPAGDYLCVAVHDTGAGMDSDTTARAFEPFFTTKAPGRGTGLGLSQVYGFARQSGGAATIDSAPGKGSSVCLYLPRIAGDMAPRAAVSAPATARPGPAMDVLLVEDDLQVAELVDAMLSDLGHRVQRAEHADAALAILNAGTPFDLMLTDLIMPGDKSGVDLARAAVRLRPGLPVILSSGYTGEVLTAAEDAPWPLLRKPYGPDELAAAIAGVSSTPPPSGK